MKPFDFQFVLLFFAHLHKSYTYNV